MDTLEFVLTELATAVGGAIKTIKLRQGDLSLLTLADKSSIVAAINQVHAIAVANGGGTEIDDTAGNGDTDSTWSADKIFASIDAAVVALESKIMGPGISDALDTLADFSAALANDPNFAATIATGLNQRVRFDQPQGLTASERLQACQNIGIGDPSVDLVAVFNAALV